MKIKNLKLSSKIVGAMLVGAASLAYQAYKKDDSEELETNHKSL